MVLRTRPGPSRASLARDGVFATLSSRCGLTGSNSCFTPGRTRVSSCLLAASCAFHQSQVPCGACRSHPRGVPADRRTTTRPCLFPLARLPRVLRPAPVVLLLGHLASPPGPLRPCPGSSPSEAHGSQHNTVSMWGGRPGAPGTAPPRGELPALPSPPVSALEMVHVLAALWPQVWWLACPQCCKPCRSYRGEQAPFRAPIQPCGLSV